MKSLAHPCLTLIFLAGVFLFLSGVPCLSRAEILITNSPALTNSEENVRRLMDLIQRRKFYEAQDFYAHQGGFFSPDQRNAIGLRIAQSLVTTNSTAKPDSALPPANTLDDSAMYLLNTLIEDYEYITVQDGVYYRDCTVTDPAIIKYLIASLSVIESGDSRFINGNSRIIIQMLTTLTRRQTGYRNGDDGFFHANHQAVIAWWQQWWIDNHDRHPVFDAPLEQQLRTAILKLDHDIQTVSPTGFHWDSTTPYELSAWGNLYSGNEWNGGPPDAAFGFGYGHLPFNIAANGDYSFLFPKADILYLRGEYLTKGLRPNDQPYPSPWQHKLPPPVEIYHQTVPGTGVALKVEIISTNSDLVESLRTNLNRR